jgi:glutamyl/glutaminyl-tRNA synthetase
MTKDQGQNREVRVRFAPSPTGALHVGNVRTALFNWLWARQQKGSFIIRIEDTDVARSRVEYEQQIYEDLRWLGLDWDEGPDVGGDVGPYRQSQRLEIYGRRAQELLQAGLAYHCFCTPEELNAERQSSVVPGPPGSLVDPGPGGKNENQQLRTKDQGPRTKDQGQMTSYVYSGKCRALGAAEVEARQKQGQPSTIRFKVRTGLVRWEDWVRGPVEWQTRLLGDFVIIKSDGWPVYNFAVVVDDIAMNITDVIRGDGHLPNTPRQILIYEALGAEPPRFGHLSTILGPDGTKLSKRHGATSIAEFRQQGYLPEALFNFLALLGWQPEKGSEGRDQGSATATFSLTPDPDRLTTGLHEILSREQLIDQFSMNRVGKAPAMFDVEKLNWLNRHYLKQTPVDRLVELSIPYLRCAGRLAEAAPDEATRAWLKLVLEMVAPRLDHLSQVVRETDVIFEVPGPWSLVPGEEDQRPQTKGQPKTQGSRTKDPRPRSTKEPGDQVREVLGDPAAVAVVQAWYDEWQKAITPLRGKLQAPSAKFQTVGIWNLELGISFVEGAVGAFEAATTAVKSEPGRAGRALFHPLRIALTGRGSGPELQRLVPIYELGSELDLPQRVLSVAARLRLFLERATKNESTSQ